MAERRQTSPADRLKPRALAHSAGSKCSECCGPVAVDRWKIRARSLSKLKARHNKYGQENPARKTHFGKSIACFFQVTDFSKRDLKNDTAVTACPNTLALS